MQICLAIHDHNLLYNVSVKFNKIIDEIGAWMDNYTPLFHVCLITNPFRNPYIG